MLCSRPVSNTTEEEEPLRWSRAIRRFLFEVIHSDHTSCPSWLPYVCATWKSCPLVRHISRVELCNAAKFVSTFICEWESRNELNQIQIDMQCHSFMRLRKMCLSLAHSRGAHMKIRSACRLYSTSGRPADSICVKLHTGACAELLRQYKITHQQNKQIWRGKPQSVLNYKVTHKKGIVRHQALILKASFCLQHIQLYALQEFCRRTRAHCAATVPLSPPQQQQQQSSPADYDSRWQQQGSNRYDQRQRQRQQQQQQYTTEQSAPIYVKGTKVAAAVLTYRA